MHGSGDIALPQWLAKSARKKRAYVTRTGGQWLPLDVALAFALTLRQHEADSSEAQTIAALRVTARELADRVCRETAPSLKKLARTVKDGEVIQAALNIINRCSQQLNIAPEQPFKWSPAYAAAAPVPALVEPPRCHMKPMRLAGAPEQRHWKCQHCSHTKPIDWSSPHEQQEAAA